MQSCGGRPVPSKNKEIGEFQFGVSNGQISWLVSSNHFLYDLMFGKCLVVGESGWLMVGNWLVTGWCCGQYLAPVVVQRL